MSKIRGTTIELKKFIFDVKSDIKVFINGQPLPVFNFEKGRKLKIPDYQREIRWSKEVVIQLINDLNHKEKFLGNVIITPLGNDIFEIIDGQQRITVLMMIINYIKNKYSEEINDLENLVELDLNCFSEYKLFQNNMYSDDVCDADREKIVSSDKFNQRKRLNAIYKEISENSAFNTIDKTRKLLDNLLNSSINVVISEDDDVSRSTQYYIDVNLKGVKLDNEDIFKGYVFAQN